MTDKLIVCGVDQTADFYNKENDREAIKAVLKERYNTVAEAVGSNRFVFAPGCSMPLDVNPYVFTLMKRSSRKPDIRNSFILRKPEGVHSASGSGKSRRYTAAVMNSACFRGRVFTDAAERNGCMQFDQVREMLLYAAEQIIDSKPYLTQIDSAIGDGDHGIGMALGLEKAKLALESCETGNVYALFSDMGRAMLMSMGGASGVIFGTMFMGGTTGKSPASQLDSAAFAQLMKDSLAAIQKRGGASEGDKAMVDALAPAVRALETGSDQPMAESLKAAAEAARQGMEDTKNYPAKFGRAKSLMERSIGHQDAGATSVFLIFQAMADYAQGRQDL